MRSSPSSLFFIFLLLTLILTESTDELEKVRKALENFKKNITYDSTKVNWGTENKTCNWTGVHCDNTTESQVFVDYFQLPGSSVIGKIPSNSLGNIRSLRSLSLHDNNFSGPFPDDFDNLQQLTNVYLHNNYFSGEFPSSVTKWNKLFTLDLSNNKFNGSIPLSISNLIRIENLYLQNNSFSGPLPNSFPSTLSKQNFSVAYNNFSGKIPDNFDGFPDTAFDGNPYLCGKPLKRRCPPGLEKPPSPSASLSSDHKKKKKLSSGGTIAIAIGSAWILLISLICLGKRWSQAVKEKKTAARTGRGFGDGGEAGTSSSKDDVTGPNLVFFGGRDCSFDIEHLFRASAEVLGKGSVGKTYKTVLNEGNTVVVKRLKDVDVSKEKFEGVMEELRKVKDENVVPIRAYYYSKIEKLLVCDYYPAGSLFALLHGSRGSGWTPLDWNHRFGIALSAAKGVACLHVAEVVHGNIKSSNILLRQDSNKDADVSDFGLNKLFGGSSTPNTRVTGYRAPEVLDTREVTFKSDVYSFGVLLIELLSGKAPNYASLGEKGTDLPSWVKSVKGEEGTVREKWITEVFDAQLMMYQNIEEMVQLLDIAMECVSIVPDKRPAMQKVVWMMEDMNRAETNDEMRQSSDDPSKGSDGHKPPMESRNSPNTVTP